MKINPVGHRVLVVSNDFTVRESLGGILDAADFTVLLAANGREALKLVRTQPVKAIVLDYRAPAEAKGGTPRHSNLLEALTDLDPFRPVILTCKPEVKLDYRSRLMADLILHHPLTPAALLDGLRLLLSESLRERAFRKSELTTMAR
ncbi:MAG TPA: hypothetical protein PKN95_04455 [Verrucomicrobiota bacterium]|nr:hypothetical protein [Verrucomicrobiota bacterium]HNT14904.1 hypothetical protein [Verrucomicrobiota bacterium]